MLCETAKTIDKVNRPLDVKQVSKTRARQTFKWEFDPGSGRTLAACLTHASRAKYLEKIFSEWFSRYLSGGRVSNAWATCLSQRDSLGKLGLIPYDTSVSHDTEVKAQSGERWSHVPLVSWWGNGSPRPRWVAGLRGWTATLELRHGPDSYGRQQWGILHNGGNSDAATSRERWRLSSRKVLS